MEKSKKKTGPKPGKPKKYATFYIENDLLERKPDSSLVNKLLQEHYEQTLKETEI